MHVAKPRVFGTFELGSDKHVANLLLLETQTHSCHLVLGLFRSRIGIAPRFIA